MDLLHISQKIRELRLSRKITVEQLAKKSGFSKGFISQVENFRVTPSLKALFRIAEALGTDMNGLFSPEGPAPEYTFGNLSEGEILPRNESEKYGMCYRALAYPQTGRKMDPFMVEYRKSTEERSFMMHDTDEFFLLLEGNLVFIINDEANRHPMNPGDTLYLKANLPHRAVLAEGCGCARALIVYS